MAATGSVPSVGCGAGSGSFGKCSGGCWPASPKVALVGVAASGGSTRSGSGVAPPRSSRGRHPGPSRRIWGQPSAARRRRQALVELCSAPVTPAAGGWPRAGPPLTPRASVPPAKGSSRLETRAMRIEPAALATSIGTLTTLDPSEGFPQALQQVVEAAKLLFQADGAGLMLVGKDELLAWASASDAQAERAEAVQADLGAGPCMVAWRERSPVA